MIIIWFWKNWDDFQIKWRKLQTSSLLVRLNQQNSYLKGLSKFQAAIYKAKCIVNFNSGIKY